MKRRRLPVVTTFYVLVLAATTAVQYSVPSQVRHRLLDGSSTDIAHLGRDPLLVLVASAFWLPDLTSVLFLPLVAGVLAAGERRFGATRAVAAFVVGHIGVTLVTEGTVWSLVAAGWLSESHKHRLDVGPSYGACAVFGLLVAAQPWSRRAVAYVAAALLFGVPLIFDSELTTTGHVLAVALGIVLWQVPWFRRGPVVREAPRAPCRHGCSSVSHC
jgi:hypothetical protein